MKRTYIGSVKIYVYENKYVDDMWYSDIDGCYHKASWGDNLLSPYLSEYYLLQNFYYEEFMFAIKIHESLDSIIKRLQDNGFETIIKYL